VRGEAVLSLVDKSRGMIDLKKGRSRLKSRA
jgi:hypothetical protein